ncbi:MAG: phage tail tape measure protein [Clostridia bacterium]
MAITRDISTRLILEGEKEYRAAMGQIGKEYRVLDSELKKVDSDFKGQQNTLAALGAKNKALNDVIAKQTDRLNTERAALNSVQSIQGTYAQQAETARAKLDNLAKTTDDATKETQEYKDAIAKLQAEISKNEAAEVKCTDAVANHTIKANQAQVKLNDLNHELTANGKYLNEAKSSADGCAKSIDAFGKETKETGEDAAEMGKKGKSGVEALASALAVAGLAKTLDEIKQAVQACISSSVEFESAMAGVAKTTSMTDAELKEMGDNFKEMSSNIPMAAKELASIAEAAGQLGVAKGDIVEFTSIMSMLGTATDMTSTEAATLLAQLVAVTGMDASQYSNLGSSIVALGNNFSTTEKKITEMAQSVSGAATNAGMNETDILALSTAVTSLGIEAVTGGTNMSALIGAMQTAVETGKGLEDWAAAAAMTATEFAALWGTDATAALRAFVVGLGDTDESMLQTLQTLGITEARTTRMITSLANAEKKNSTLSKAISLSSKAWTENNALTKEAATRYETTESKIKMYENSVENLKTAVGDQLTPALGELADTGADVVAWAASFVEQNRWLAPALTGVATALAALAAGVVTVTVVIPALKAAWTALTTALTASPWMLAASAVLGLVAALGTYAVASKTQVDDLAGAATGLPEAFKAANDGYAETLVEIEGTKAKADALISRLQELEQKNTTTSLNADEWREWNALLGSLVETIPTLANKINLQTGEIDGGTAALERNASAWHQNAIEQAKVAALQSKYDAYASAIGEVEENRIKLTIATKAAETADSKYKASMERLTAATGITEEQLHSTGDGMASLQALVAGVSSEYGGMVEETVKLNKESADAQGEVDDLANAVVIGEEAVAAASGEIDAYSAALAVMDGASTGAADGVNGLTDAQSNQVTQFETMQAQLQALSEAYAKYYEDALKNISGVVSGFDEVTQAETKSIDDSMKALDSQLSYLSTYSSNLLKLKELADANGIDLNTNLVSKLGDGSVESAAILQGIVDDGGTKLADLNSKFSLVEEGKKTFAEIMAEMQTDFTTKTNAMITQMQTLVTGLDQSSAASTNAQATVNAMNKALEAGISATQAIVSRYNLALAQLGRTRTVKLSTSGYHAAGLPAVPYDNYVAVLHKDERVMTALQAKAQDAQDAARYNYPRDDPPPRAIQPATVQPVPIDYDQLGRKVAASMDGVVVAIDGERAGMLLWRHVSEAQGDEVTTGRFGT